MTRQVTATSRAWWLLGVAPATAAMSLLTGCEPRAAQREEARGEVAVSPALVASGEKVYTEHCATCHMADGHGVPNMQPGLVGSPIVTGDPARLYAVIRAGSAALRDRESEFGNEMPPFGMLSEDEVTAVADYVRRQFGGNES